MELTPIKIAIGSLWLITGLLEYLDYCYIWQLKEYRRDRFQDFLSTEQGRRYFLRLSFLVNFVAFLVAVFYPINNEGHLKYILFGVLIFDFLVYSIKFFRHKLRRPKLTPKAILIVLLSLTVGTGTFIFLKDWSLAFLILLCRFFILTGVMMVVAIPTRMSKYFIIKRATKKIKKFPKLTIIGITGSYGKSSVKEFAAHLLSQKYTVVRTPKNTNSEIGIAQFILKADFSKADVFVVEMGAYTKGEIKLICDMVHPSIGILTAIAEQHLALFGSMKNIQSAKYELLRSIPSTGLVITNADNHYCTELLSELECKNVETFGTDEENHPTCLTTDIQATIKGTEFEGIYRGNTGRVVTPVIGAHHAYNIAPAAILAIHFGLTKEQLEQGCATLPTNIHGSLHIYQYGKATIIDDTYNSNPQGFKSALDVLSSFSSSKKRVVITRGMLELGEKSEEMHERIGEEIAFTADELIVITPDSFESLKRGVGEKYRTKVFLQDDPQQLLKSLKMYKDQESVILLENRMPIGIIEELSTYQ